MMNTNQTIENEDIQYYITFNNENRQSIIVEPVDSNNKNNKGFFYEEYKKAEEILISILEQNEQRKTGYSNSVESASGSIVSEPYNNLILFHGDRGSGKTSTMLSFAKYLEKAQLEGYRFELLPLIDPSFFRDSDNILHSVLSSMFSCAKKCYEDSRNAKIDLDSFKNLIKIFSRVFSNLQKMNNISKKEDDIEYLDTLSDASNIKQNIQELIQKYLQFMGQGENAYLVLMIDDMDMNMQCAPQMLEQVQKFLIQENLIILMASRLGQFQLEMKDHYGKSFSMKNGDDSILLELSDITNKYLFKLFPPSHRICINNSSAKLLHTGIRFTPSSTRDSNTGLNYFNNSSGCSNCSENLNRTDLDLYEGKDLQAVILNLIWRKTRLIFTPRINRLHPIIPTNLRSLKQFIYMLLDMENVEYTLKERGPNNPKTSLFKDEKAYKTARENLKQFKNFFVEIWIGGNLTYDEQQVFQHIPDNGGEINKYLIQKINEIGYKYKKAIVIKDDLVDDKGRGIQGQIYTMVSPSHPIFKKANEVSDIGVYHSNSSTGDLLIVIDSYEKYFESDRELRFIEAVKVYYSICMLEAMFFKKNVETQGFITPIIELIGGTLYAQCQFKLIQLEGKDNQYFNLDNQNQYLYNLPVKIEENSNPKKDNLKEENCNLLEKIRGQNKYIEYFISYYGIKKPDRFFKKHIYETKLETEGTENYIRFDVFSLLVNTLNLKDTCERAKVDIGDTEERSEKWKNFNAVDTIDYRNTILPIYSLDLLFTYFRYSWGASSNQFKENKIEDFKSNILKKEIGYSYILKLNPNIEENKQKLTDFLNSIKSLHSIKNTGDENPVKITKKKDITDFINSCENKTVDEIEIVTKTMLNTDDSRFKEKNNFHLENRGVKFLERGKSINILDLKEAFLSQKDQDELIDESKENPEQNQCIIKTYKKSFEKYIQETVIGKEFCQSYYTYLLSDLTIDKCLERISIKKEKGERLGDISSVYKNLCEEGSIILELEGIKYNKTE